MGQGLQQKGPQHREDLLTFYWGLKRFGNCHHHVGAKDLEQKEPGMTTAAQEHTHRLSYRLTPEPGVASVAENGQ